MSISIMAGACTALSRMDGYFWFSAFVLVLANTLVHLYGLMVLDSKERESTPNVQHRVTPEECMNKNIIHILVAYGST